MEKSVYNSLGQIARQFDVFRFEQIRILALENGFQFERPQPFEPLEVKRRHHFARQEISESLGVRLHSNSI